MAADTHDPVAVAALLRRGYRPNTQQSYMSKFRAFVRYCCTHGRAPLPADVSTVVGYVLHEQHRGALAPPSLDKYLTALGSIHRLAGYADPTRDYLVRLSVYGFRAWALDEAGGELKLQRMPLPASFILRVCDLGLATPDSLLRIQCAGLVLAYLLFNRPGAAACIRHKDVAFTANGLELQVVDFKMALRTGRERHAFTVPIHCDPAVPDKPAALVRLVWAQHLAAGREPNDLLFADPHLPPPVRKFNLAARVTNTWMRRLLRLVPVLVPLGGIYQGHSLRSGAATEAHAIGVPLPMVSEMLGHSSLEVTLRAYVKTRWRATPAAREVMGRFLPSHLRL